MQTVELPVADRLKSLKTASELAAACGKSRFLIINMMNDGRLPDYVIVGNARKATLESLWAAFEREAERDRERRGIKPQKAKTSAADRAARVEAARASLGCKTPR